jgi:hypothetical protein
MTARAATILVLMSAGCSFIGVRQPEVGKQCVRSYGPPVVDTMVAAAAAAGSIKLFLIAEQQKQDAREAMAGNDTEYQSVQLVGTAVALPALIYAASAAFGYVYVGQCNCVVK